MTSPFDSLVGKTLSAEPFDPKEFEGLKASGLARLKDSENRSLSLPSRFDLAYNASHAPCLAALRHHGFRADKRYTVFQVLPLTLSLGPEVWRVLDKAHNLRNRSEYDGSFDIDERIVTDLVAACRTVATQLEKLSGPR